MQRTFASQRDNHLVRNSVRSHHHSALLHGFFVYRYIDSVGRNHLSVRIFRAHPVLDDVLQFEGFFTKLLFRLFRILTIILFQFVFQRRLNRYSLIRSRAIVKSWPSDRHRRRVVSRSLHLVNIPIGLYIREVTNSCIGTHTFHILVVPQRECVVITIGKDNRIAFIL